MLEGVLYCTVLARRIRDFLAIFLVLHQHGRSLSANHGSGFFFILIGGAFPQDVLLGVEARDWPKIKQVVAEVHPVGDRVIQVCNLLRGHGFDVSAQVRRILYT